MNSSRARLGGAFALVLVISLAACGGGAATPTAEPTPDATPPAEASEPEATATATPNSGDATIDAPESVEAGAEFEVAWTGPANNGDYITIVTPDATQWQGGDDYFDVSIGSPGELTAPTAPGDYVLWYVSGADDEILLRVPIAVTPFTGSLLAPEEVPAGTEFDVAWNGPGAAGDYVTIVPVGAERWTAGDWYFDVSVGSPGQLWAPMKEGAYEIWYVAGVDETVQARIPITVLPLEISLDAPDEVAAGSTFEVEWTGPDGDGDYITIVPEGAAEGAYLDYAYTYEGNPVEITAPDEPGEYEIWYASDRVNGTFSRLPITVTP